MALMKATLLLQVATNSETEDTRKRRIGGWSESYLGDDLGPVHEGDFGNRDPIYDLCVARARLLPKGGLIIGQRLQLINPIGPTATFQRQFPGASNLSCDVPQMCLLFKAAGVGVINSRPVDLRGLPDARVVQGEYFPSAPYTASIANFFQVLSRFKFRAVDLTQPATPILTISALGVVVTEIPTVLVAGEVVRILRTTNAEKDRTGGRYVIDTVAGGITITLKGWDHGACKGGKIRKEVIIHPAFSDVVPTPKVGTRKVGRPFDQYRGRASARH